MTVIKDGNGNIILKSRGGNEDELREAREGEFSLDDRLDKFRSQLADIGRSTEEFPRLTGETTDSAKIQRAVDALNAGDVLIFPYGKTYDINATITITKTIHIVGYGATLKTVTNGLDNTFNISTANEFTLFGLKFDQNLLFLSSMI